MDDRPHIDFLKRLALWTAVCSLSAAPSFILAVTVYNTPAQVLAMLLGIVTFILAYTLGSGLEFARRWRRDRAIRTTMMIGYGTRMAISAIIPIGMVADLIVGAFSMSFSDALFGGSSFMRSQTAGGEAPFVIFITTLIHGGMWNVLLAIYMLFVYAIARMVIKTTPAGLCINCGYDLRASPTMCPECGTPVGTHQIATVESS